MLKLINLNQVFHAKELKNLRFKNIRQFKFKVFILLIFLNNFHTPDLKKKLKK